MCAKKMQAVRKQGGKVDDVAVSCKMFRLERLTEEVWWAAAYRGNKQVSFLITRDGDTINVTVQTDTVGCKDDTKR